MLLFLSFEPISLTKTDSHLQNHPPREFRHTHSPDHSHPAPLRHDHLTQNYTISHPSLISTYHVQPLPYLLGNAPTIGQAIYVIFLLVLNIAFTAGGYRSTQPNAWFSSPWQETMGYVSCRTGVLGFALLPLTIVFSGRNNVLLRLSDWSHGTYMLLHR